MGVCRAGAAKQFPVAAYGLPGRASGISEAKGIYRRYYKGECWMKGKTQGLNEFFPGAKGPRVPVYIGVPPQGYHPHRGNPPPLAP